MGRVLKPTLWYNAKLKEYPGLSMNSMNLKALESFVEFLEEKGMYIGVIESGRDEDKFTSIYNNTSMDRKHWVCDIKFFSDGTFASNVEVLCKEKMNTSGKLYENEKFAKVLGVLTGRGIDLGNYATIKEKLDFIGFTTALEELCRAIEIYKIFR